VSRRLAELIACRFPPEMLVRVRKVLPADWSLSEYIRVAVLEKVTSDEKEHLDEPAD
jgi:hypothetical protein